MFLMFLFCLASGLIVYIIKHHYSYWERNGFPSDPGTKIPFGCLGAAVRKEKSMGMAIHDVYLRTNARFCGIYLLYKRGILIRDPTLAKQILTQDFTSFHDRGVYVDEKNNPLSANLFSLQGQRWQEIRQKLSPSFSSGKLKGMFKTANDVGDKLVQHLNQKVPDNGIVEVEIRDVFVTFAIDIIGSVIFGLEIDSFVNPTNKFRKSVTIRAGTWMNTFLTMVNFLCPSAMNVFFRLGFQNPIALSLLDIIKETVEYREKNNVVRKDLLQLLIQLRNTGNINEDDTNWDAKSIAGQKKSMSLEEIVAHAFIFYIAGQETTAATATYTIYELAQRPALLKKAQDEIDAVLKETEGEYTYEALGKMEYLDRCLQETLRKYPGLPFFNRECTKDYKIPGTDEIITKGTSIIIPIYGIHRDEKYFPNPLEYDPDRFLSENRESFNNTAYMPFGAGPRICIAQRLGIINAKLGAAKFLENFHVEQLPYQQPEYAAHAVGFKPRDGIKLKLSKRGKNKETI